MFVFTMQILFSLTKIIKKTFDKSITKIALYEYQKIKTLCKSKVTINNYL